MTTAESLDELTVPGGWAATDRGMSCDDEHAIDGVHVGRDPELRVVVRDLHGGGAVVPRPPGDNPGTYADWALDSILADGYDLEAMLGPHQAPLLRTLLDEIGLGEEPAVRLGALFRSLVAPRRGSASGGAFVFGLSAEVPALWGDGDRVLWSEGEGLMVAGPQGVGKTTLLQLLALARIGIGPAELLGLPVKRDDRPVLYLAMDRPRQAARSMRRMVNESEHGEILDERLRVWLGPLPFDLLKDPKVLARWATEEFGAGAVFVDSYKDLATNLSSEETGSVVNMVVQECLAEGIEWAGAHHNRKAQGENRRPDKLDDIHGSGWLTRGLGSVVSLWGEAGAELSELAHLKQPAGRVGPLVISHDRVSGSMTALTVDVGGQGAEVEHRKRILAVFAARGGASAPSMSMAELEAATDRKKGTLQPALNALVERSLLAHAPGGGPGNPSTWRMLPLDGPTEQPG